MRIILICIFVLVSGCVKDYDLNPATTIVRQLFKASYDEKRVRPLETFKEKHTGN
jgi:hypothetical protein